MSAIITYITDHPWWTLIYLSVICQAIIYTVAAWKSGNPKDL